ncbi:MAG: lipoyl(octanoyl) transferase LipB [Phycisphaeraceae bacterium]
MTLPDPTTIQPRDLGRLPYAPAFALQRELNQAVIDGRHPPTILLVEHDPVITLTRRKSVRDHLLADDATLAGLGIDTQETDRGGDITYHGPGQLVVYPILKLGDLGLNLSSYMRLLEQAVIDTAGYFGVQAHRECGATGVWVKRPRAGFARTPGAIDKRQLAGESSNSGPDTDKPSLVSATPQPHTAKLCAMGVRIRKNTTMHGLAFNVEPDLSHFQLIVPCGLHGRPVTSMKQLLGEASPTMQQAKAQLTERLVDLLRKQDRNAPGSSCVTGSARGTTAGSLPPPGRPRR